MERSTRHEARDEGRLALVEDVPVRVPGIEGAVAVAVTEDAACALPLLVWPA